MGLPQETAESRAFARLYAENFRFVWSLAARLGVPPASREDVAQEVWLTVHRRLHTLVSAASARAWVAAITRKIASRQHRTHHRAERKLAALAAVVETPRSWAGERDSFAWVDDALARMDPAQREVFLLGHVEELSGPEIAEAIGAPLNTVYSRMRLARARLCDFLAQVEVEEALIVEAIRRRDAPPRDASSKVWLAIASGFGDMSSVPVLGISLATKLAIIGATAVATVSIIVGFFAIEAAGHDDVAAAPAPVVAVAPAIRDPPSIPTTPVDLIAPAPTAPASVVQRARERAVHTSPSPLVSPSSGKRSVDTLAAESSLLGEARRALAHADAAHALALLDDHARRFPNGTMNVDARALRVRSLCALGRTEEAERTAAALLEDFPSSPSAVGVRDACDAKAAK